MREVRKFKKKNMVKQDRIRVPVLVQQKRIRLGTMRLQVRSLALLSGLRIQHYCELWCRLKTGLGSGTAVTVA